MFAPYIAMVVSAVAATGSAAYSEALRQQARPNRIVPCEYCGTMLDLTDLSDLLSLNNCRQCGAPKPLHLLA